MLVLVLTLMGVDDGVTLMDVMKAFKVSPRMSCSMLIHGSTVLTGGALYLNKWEHVALKTIQKL